VPSKLEWAALHLQAHNGRLFRDLDDPVAVSFIPQPDGRTIECVIQYLPNHNSEVLDILKDAIDYSFSRYREQMGWRWLRFRFHERVIPDQD